MNTSIQRGNQEQGGSPGFLFGQASQGEEGAAFPRSWNPQLLACTDGHETDALVIRHARAVASGLDLSITLGRVAETPRHPGSPADPLDWQMHRAKCRHELEQLARSQGSAQLEHVLLVGTPAEALGRWGLQNGAALIALATRERPGPTLDGLSATAKALLERSEASLLLVPPGDAGCSKGAYRRLLVPLDGSSRAESVLPLAVRIARRHGAEIILAHVVPNIDLVGSTNEDASGRNLRSQLKEHNEQRAREYLETLRLRLWRDHVPVRSMIAAGGDPRALLRQIAAEQHADLVVLSSHGQSGMKDVACGSVTEYLAAHAPAPMLIVRPGFAPPVVRPDLGTARLAALPVSEMAG